MRVHTYSKSSFSHLFVRSTVLLFILAIGTLALAGKFASAKAGDLIPEDAIRIRIVANSDGKFDQQVKTAVRDAVAASIQGWGAMPSTHDEAYAVIRAHLPAIKKIANKKLKEFEVSYGAKVELAKVPFPAKTFDGEKYAAGNYEALRVTLGKGAGANWWCVLFPPLCLTSAIAKDDADASKATASSTAHAGGSEQPKPKFFLWVLLQKLFALLRALFS